MRRRIATPAALALATWASTALAQAPEPAKPAPAPATSILPKGWEPSYSIGGYVDAAYTYGFEKPSNGVLDYRAFDNRHNTFTLQNAVIHAQGKLGNLSARVALQVGRAPETYYAGAPSPGTATTPPSTPEAFRFVQQAYGGYKFDVANGLAVEAGIFLSPMGLESLNPKDNWNYSRSNLYFGLPVYHTGLRLSLDVTDRLSLLFMVTNGYNSVVDNNAGKSVMSQISYKIPDRLLVAFLYMGGPERPSGAPEGEPWRHVVDGYVSAQLASWVELAAAVDAGFERTRMGISGFGAVALYARFHPVSWLYLATRGDRWAEHRAEDKSGTASPMAFPAAWVSSGTFTADFRPHDHVSLRVEYRHDQASTDLYFAGAVKGDGEKVPFVPNAKAQNTLSIGALAWF